MDVVRFFYDIALLTNQMWEAERLFKSQCYCCFGTDSPLNSCWTLRPDSQISVILEAKIKRANNNCGRKREKIPSETFTFLLFVICFWADTKDFQTSRLHTQRCSILEETQCLFPSSDEYILKCVGAGKCPVNLQHTFLIPAVEVLTAYSAKLTRVVLSVLVLSIL